MNETKDFNISRIGVDVLKRPMPFVFIDAIASNPFMFQQNDGSGFINEPEKEINFKSNFHLCAFQCTQEFWQAVVTHSSGCNLPAYPSKFIGLTRPVDSVSWDDIQLFVRALNQLLIDKKLFSSDYEDDFLEIHGEFALPSETQWEFAACANQQTLFAGSNNIEEVAWYDDNNDKYTTPVGLKKPNAFQLYDMCGNVWEWCQNDYNYEGIQLDGESGTNITDVSKPLRGGGYFGRAQYCRLRFRVDGNPDYRGDFRGFRLRFSPGSKAVSS